MEDDFRSLTDRPFARRSRGRAAFKTHSREEHRPDADYHRGGFPDDRARHERRRSFDHGRGSRHHPEHFDFRYNERYERRREPFYEDRGRPSFRRGPFRDDRRYDYHDEERFAPPRIRDLPPFDPPHRRPEDYARPYPDNRRFDDFERGSRYSPVQRHSYDRESPFERSRHSQETLVRTPRDADFSSSRLDLNNSLPTSEQNSSGKSDMFNSDVLEATFGASVLPESTQKTPASDRPASARTDAGSSPSTTASQASETRVTSSSEKLEPKAHQIEKQDNCTVEKPKKQGTMIPGIGLAADDEDEFLYGQSNTLKETPKSATATSLQPTEAEPKTDNPKSSENADIAFNMDNELFQKYLQKCGIPAEVSSLLMKTSAANEGVKASPKTESQKQQAIPKQTSNSASSESRNPLKGRFDDLLPKVATYESPRLHECEQLRYDGMQHNRQNVVQHHANTVQHNQTHNIAASPYPPAAAPQPYHSSSYYLSPEVRHRHEFPPPAATLHFPTSAPHATPVVAPAIQQPPAHTPPSVSERIEQKLREAEKVGLPKEKLAILMDEFIKKTGQPTVTTDANRQRAADERERARQRHRSRSPRRRSEYSKQTSRDDEERRLRSRVSPPSSRDMNWMEYERTSVTPQPQSDEKTSRAPSASNSSINMRLTEASLYEAHSKMSTPRKNQTDVDQRPPKLDESALEQAFSAYSKPDTAAAEDEERRVVVVKKMTSDSARRAHTLSEQQRTELHETIRDCENAIKDTEAKLVDLSRKQNELMRKCQRGRNPHNDPALRSNEEEQRKLQRQTMKFREIIQKNVRMLHGEIEVDTEQSRAMENRTRKVEELLLSNEKVRNSIIFFRKGLYVFFVL